MIVYYAKFNINSNLKEIKNDRKKLEDILSNLAHEIDSRPYDFEYVHLVEYSVEEINDEGDITKKKIIEEEYYRFINTKRIVETRGDIIVGELMRERPDNIRVYDDEDHKIKKSGINRRAFSTFFVFDLRSETVAFTERHGIGRRQFVNAFENLCQSILKGISIKVYLKQDPRSFVEKVKELTKINEIEIEIISPNFVNDAVDELEKEAREMGDKMDAQNITKIKNHLETSKENKEGIDINGELAKKELKKYSIMSILGYAKGKITGFIGKDARIIKSEEEAPYMTNISYNDREDETSFIEHVLRGIRQESTRRAIARELKKGPTDNEEEN